MKLTVNAERILDLLLGPPLSMGTATAMRIADHLSTHGVIAVVTSYGDRHDFIQAAERWHGLVPLREATAPPMHHTVGKARAEERMRREKEQRERK